MTKRETVQCQAHKLVSPSQYRNTDWLEQRRLQNTTDRCEESATTVRIDRYHDNKPQYLCEKHDGVYGRIHKFAEEDIPVAELPDLLYAQVERFHQQAIDQSRRDQRSAETARERAKDNELRYTQTLDLLRRAREEA